MTKKIQMLPLLVLLTGIAVTQEARSSNTQQSSTPASAVQNSEVSEEAGKESPPTAAVFRNGKEKLSYALGVNLATGLKWQEIDVDTELLVRGFRDAISKDDKLLMPAKDLAETIKSFQEDRKKGIEHARQMLSDKNKKQTSDFLALNAKKEGVVTLPSGLQYKVLKLGEGEKPALGDTVVCNYRGTLLQGKEFDSSYKRNEPATIPIKGLIKGWTEALQLMPTGSKWQLFIPPQLGYGDRVVGDIGPNSTLIFEVELLSIQNKAQKVQDTPQNLASTPQGSL
jgi:FKBP-type peptidyl-prolyl cis-trans isomerase